MEVKIIGYTDKWKEIKEAALVTINKDMERYPSTIWKSRILKAEHSPIRLGVITFQFNDIQSFVANHLVRHHVGVNSFVSTNRDDRITTDEIPNRLSPVRLRMECNFSAILNISRRRLCGAAHPSTKGAWMAALEELKQFEPELVSLCVPDCVYRGLCCEMFSCGYSDTNAYKNHRLIYEIR